MPRAVFEMEYGTTLSLARFDDTFETFVSDGVRVTVRKLRNDERGYQEHDPRFLCIARVSRELDDAKTRAFRDIEANHLPVGGIDVTDLPDYVSVDRTAKYSSSSRPDLHNCSVQFEWLSPDLQGFIDDIRSMLSEAATRTIKIARWYSDAHGDHRAMQTIRQFRCSFNETSWFSVPDRTSVFAESRNGLRLDSTTRRDLVQLLADEQVNEPLGHELFREAWSQRHGNPRSALIVGVAAAEAGVKAFITKHEPGSRWLIENAPSPPLVNMINQFLPIVLKNRLIRREGTRPPKEIVSEIEGAVKLRNKVVHGIDRAIDSDQLERMLAAIRDLLWMLDVYNGYEWARAHVRANVLAQWDPGESVEL